MNTRNRTVHVSLASWVHVSFRSMSQEGWIPTNSFQLSIASCNKCSQSQENEGQEVRYAMAPDTGTERLE